jgi:hypothetical protein
LFQQDYFKRQLELFAQVLALVVLKRKSGDLGLALDETRNAYRALGLDSSFLRLEAGSLVALVGDVAKLNALCELLEEEANVLDALSNAPEADRLRLRAGKIREATKARGEASE